jgi:hypothetical protein
VKVDGVESGGLQGSCEASCIFGVIIMSFFRGNSGVEGGSHAHRDS